MFEDYPGWIVRFEIRPSCERTVFWRSVFILFFLVTPVLVIAEEPDLANLDLKELVSFAKEHNPLYLAAAQEISIAKGDLITAGLWNNPTLTYQQAFIGGQANSEAGSTEYAPGITWELDFSGKRGLREKAAEKNLLAERLSFANYDRLFVRQLKQTYHEFLFFKELVSFKREFFSQYEALMKASEIRSKTGDISGMEYNRLELERISYEADFRSTQLRLSELAFSMRKFLGLPPKTEPLVLKGTLEFQPLSSFPELSTARTVESRPDFLMVSKKAELFEAQASLHRREMIPDILLGSEYRKKGAEGYFGVFASISLPVLDRKQGAILRAEESSKKLRLELEAKKQEIESEILMKITSLKNREETLSRYQEMGFLQKNQKVAEQSRFAYLKKAYTIVAFLESQRAYFNVLKNYYEQLFLYYFSIDDLDAALNGGIQSEGI